MKVIRFVSKEDNVICIIQVSEVMLPSEKPVLEATRSMIQSIAWQNRAGARTQPCLTPEVVKKLGERVAPILTLDVELLCRSSIS